MVRGWTCLVILNNGAMYKYHSGLDHSTTRPECITFLLHNCTLCEECALLFMMSQRHIYIPSGPCVCLASQHRAVLLREDEPTNNKETDGLTTSWPLLSIVCLMVVTWYMCYMIMFMSQFSSCQVIMVVGGGLVPIWHQGISNHHDDAGLLAYISGVPSKMESCVPQPRPAGHGSADRSPKCYLVTNNHGCCRRCLFW